MPVKNKINELVYADAYGDSRLMPQYRQIQRLQQEQLTFQSFFNGPFYEGVYGVDQSEIRLQRKQTPKLKQSAFRSFFISVFMGLQEETRDKTNQKSSAETYANPQRHLNEKVAGKADSKNRFANISYIFGEILKSGLIEYSHQTKDYHNE